MKVRDGHPFGLMQIPKNAKFKWFKWQKNAGTKSQRDPNDLEEVFIWNRQ